MYALQMGSVVASYFSGIIMHYYSWELVFYIFGILAIVWFSIYVSAAFRCSILLDSGFVLEGVLFAID